MSLKNVKNILFDLGGVIYDIDPMRTQKAIRALLPHENAVEIYSKTQQIEAISLYETGKMDTSVLACGGGLGADLDSASVSQAHTFQKRHLENFQKG